VLELIHRTVCEHVIVLPEAAGIVFGGGFPRGSDPRARAAAQRAIFSVQRELEAVAEVGNPAVVLCDRGTVDGVAYWPGPGDYWSAVGTTQAEELARYHAVIHLRTPSADNGYNRRNPLRIEAAADAARIDERIAEAWTPHPRCFMIDAEPDFIVKAERALAILHEEIPSCCRTAVASAS
jgi:hypothetical protein